MIKLFTQELLALSQHRKNAFQGQKVIWNPQRNKFNKSYIHPNKLAPDTSKSLEQLLYLSNCRYIQFTVKKNTSYKPL